MFKKIAELIGNNDKTIYRWKKEGRPIINLLEKYFTKENLEEFLSTGKIDKFEYTDSYLQNLEMKCFNIHGRFEEIRIKTRYPSHGDYNVISISSTPNAYMLYVVPFLKKYEEEIKLFNSNNFKDNFFDLALTHHFERDNGVKEPYVTFQMLEILDELSNTELYYFFNEFNIED